MVNFNISVSELEYFLLILMRIATFVYIAPFFGMSGVPSRVKIGLSLLLAYLVYKIMPAQYPEYETVLGYAIIVLKESATGLLIGFFANICMSILNFAGNISDMETGLSMVTLMDPQTKESVTITGNYYTYVITLMLMISGMYQYILFALVESFDLIPVNGAIFNTENILSGMLKFMADYLSIGFRICLPIVCIMLLLNSVLGILAKVSPQMNMFAVGMQIKILVGLGTMFLVVGLLPKVSTLILNEMKQMITLIIEALS